MVLSEFLGRKISLYTETFSLYRDFLGDFGRDFRGDFLKRILAKSYVLMYLKKEVGIFFNKNLFKVLFKGAYSDFYRWKVFSIIGKFFPPLF